MRTAISRGRNRYGGLTVRNNLTFVILIAMVIACFIGVPNFGTPDNIVNVVRQVSALTIIALGQYFVILTGGIDLSAGSTVSLVGCVAAGLMYFSGWPMPAAVLAAVFASLLVGLINGVMVVYGNIVPFITTLATMIAVKGATFLYSGGFPISGLPASFEFFGRGYVWNIPAPIVIMVGIVVIAYIFSEQTLTGRNIFAVGGNEAAARLCGVETKKVKLLAYVLGGLLAGIGGIIIASRIKSGQPTVGDNLLFDVITAVVLGGTSMAGGEGRVLGVLAGALILGVIANAMVLLRIDPYWQWIVRGAILALAVFIDARLTRK